MSRRLRSSGLILALLTAACGSPAASFIIDPAPLTGTARPVFYLAPLQDRRGPLEIWSGHGGDDKVLMEPTGSTLLAKAWHQRPFSDISYLWHRQLAYALVSAGYPVQAAAEPFADDAAALVAAHLAGAKYLLKGALKRLNMAKHGADDVLGTNFTGTRYFLNLELQWQVVEVEHGQTVLDQKLDYQQVFFDPTRLGSYDADTFPRYFAAGLPELAMKLAAEEKLRALAGLPAATATPSPSPTPDSGPYWVNPKTGRKVDPSWNFDPMDGTPRTQFILHAADPAPTPSKLTEPK